jgi:hypothetical protein
VSATSATNFKANVNRQKSRKWVEAKPVDYGGDDWGDEYDDEPYDDIPPTPAKPVGLRQPGQAVQSPVSAYDPSRKPYGELPSPPGAPQSRSVTGPVLARTNSFDKGDERRAFSIGVSQPPAGPTGGPVTRFSQMEPVAGSKALPPLHTSMQDLNVNTKKSSIQEVPTDAHHMTPSVRDEPFSARSPHVAGTGNRSYVGDFHRQDDYSPSAIPPPLSTRVSPASPIVGDPSLARFPPRKSSLSQQVLPEPSFNQRSPQAATQKPWAEKTPASPDTASNIPVSPSKALPFIRPADIYRRMEEEKEKQRQSMESSRPSLDSIFGGKSDGPSSPQKNTPRDATSPESLGRGTRRRGSIDDVVDSSKRLMPMLEPVKERKSEYGFEGFNINNEPSGLGKNPDVQPSQSSPEAEDSTVTSTNSIHPRVVESTSPKLPDLSRMSGFGADFFNPPSTNADEASFAAVVKPAPVFEHPELPSTEHTLRNEPSLGFRSAVHQAFDRSVDPNTPVTPASRSGSGIRRTDSESTGTTGISPIMSRVPSTALTETRNREAEAREVSTPAIAEESEAGSPHASGPAIAQSSEMEPPAPSFIPGHRRDMSTPSPSNSPARTPDIGITSEFPKPTEVHISEASDLSPEEPGLEGIGRPEMERDQSFRPSLPGGWISYASIPNLSTGGPQDTQPSHLSKSSTVNTDSSTSSGVYDDDNDFELTPTTTKRQLPSSALGAAAGVAFRGSAGEAFGRHDKRSQLDALQPASPRVSSDFNTSLTPDPSLAPTGNIYSSPVDPRLFSNKPVADMLPIELPAGIVPNFADRSAASSAAPTPPPKDTPLPADEDNSAYFAPPVPLKHKTAEEVAASEQLELPPRPQILPTMSTDVRPQDEESDKLRKEIVRSLSPRLSNAQETLQHEEHTTVHAPIDSGQTRDSTYLPSEYDNYWASTESDPEAFVESKPDQEEHTQGDMRHQESDDLDLPTIAPLNAKKSQQSTSDSRPALLPSRFSWEIASEPAEESTENEPTENLRPAPLRSSTSFAATPDTQLLQLEQTREAYFSHAQSSTTDSTLRPEAAKSQEEGGLTHGELVPEDKLPATGSDESVASKTIGGANAIDAGSSTMTEATGLGAGGIVAVDSTTVPASNIAQESPRRQSLVEEKDTSQAHVAELPVSPTPPENELPARASQQTSRDSFITPQQQPTPEGSTPTHSPRLSHNRILFFKDILAMKDPNKRIQTYNDTREQFASMNTGLDDWLSNLKNQHPEHANATGTWGAPAVPGSNTGRSKFVKSISTAQQLQQPYYMQYLNASSPTSPNVPVTAKPGSSFPSSSQQGGIGANKISTQQVQAKSKELLHTAGIFGGKASKAGKGLLAKGKSRFRGGAGDKVD